MKLDSSKKIILLIFLGILVLVAFWLLDTNNLLSTIQDGSKIKLFVESYPVFGPVIIISFMVIAILFSPLPSAPIAIAAGAAYGHFWGGFYVLLGSLFGAIGAFLISRYLGLDYVQKIAKNYLPEKYYHSQNILTGVVLVSRLIPFISFDIISYAAGLTPLMFWRFVIATFIGILPASFFLAHVGSELATSEMDRIAIAMFALAVLVGLSMLIPLARKKYLRKKN